MDTITKSICHLQTLSFENAARSVGNPGTLDQLKAAVRSIRFAGPGNLPHFFAMATGEKDGRTTTVGADISAEPTGMDSATTWPLAAGLRQLIDGRINATGVHPPETVVEPSDFFDQLARAFEPHLEGIDQLVTTTTS